MKISSLYYTHKPGGFCKRLYRLLNALSERGHQVTYYCLDKPPADILSPKIKWRKIPFLLKSRSGLVFWIIFGLWTPVYLLFAGNARWVVFSPFYACLLGLKKISSGDTIVSFIRSKLTPNYEYRLANLLDRLFSRLCFYLSNKVILQTESNRQLAINSGCDASKTSILPNDVERLQIKENAGLNGNLKFVTAGVFNKNKNLSLLIDCWKVLESRKHNLKYMPQLSIAGLSKNKVSIQDLPAGIEWHGWHGNFKDILLNHNVYIHPSLHEGMPNSVLEAMSQGLAILLADTSELRELAGYESMLFDPYDSEALAGKIESLVNHPNQFKDLLVKTNERARYFNFDWEQKACNVCTN